MKKKFLGYGLGAAAALALTNIAYAAADINQYFGGDSTDTAAADKFAENAFGTSSTQSFPDVIASIIQTIMGFLGIVAVVIILMGGFKWMTAGGSEDKVKEAKRLIIQGIIGLVIVIAAFAITKFVLEQVLGAVTTG